jgi:hypothetical protein
VLPRHVSGRAIRVAGEPLVHVHARHLDVGPESEHAALDHLVSCTLIKPFSIHGRRHLELHYTALYRETFKVEEDARADAA